METLKRSGQFERVRREGRTWAGGLMVLNAATNGQDAVRCGFIAGKKVGGAVERNRARRLLREALRARLPRIKPGFDLVLIARAPIVQVKLDAVGKELDELLLRGKLLLPPAETAGVQSRIIGSKGDTASQGADTPLPGTERTPVETPERAYTTGAVGTADLPETRT